MIGYPLNEQKQREKQEIRKGRPPKQFTENKRNMRTETHLALSFLLVNNPTTDTLQK